MLDAICDTSVLLTLLLVVLVAILWMNTSRRPSGLPPGPPIRVPILGNLFDLSPKQALETLRGYRSKYGDIFSLKLGTKWIVVINGLDTIKDFLVKNADVFSNRPDIFTATQVNGGMGIASSSDKLWKEHRTFALTTLRKFGFGKRNLETDIIEEVKVCLNVLEETRGTPYDIKNLISTNIANVTCALVLGRRFEHNDPRFVSMLEMLHSLFKNNGFAGLLNFIPWLMYIPGDMFKAKATIRDMRSLENITQEFLEEHKKTYDENNIRDYIDAYIKEMKDLENAKGHTFTEKQLIKSALDMFGAGTETTATTIQWAILYFLHYPEEQEKMAREIQEEVGNSRFPSLEDRSNLIYCEAVITEVLRCGDIVPLSLPHATDRDFEYKGHIIPKDAIILPNLDSIMTDSEVFHNPETFNPSRFLGKDGKLVGQDNVLVFSTGRRVCLGEALARMELFLFLTSMVQRFKFVPEEGKPVPSLDGVIGVTRSPNPYKMRAILRT